MSDKPIDEAVTISRAADLLLVSISTIRRLLAEKAFPNAYRVKRSVRIPKSDIEAYQRANAYIR